jgi:hypothetical protein
LYVSDGGHSDNLGAYALLKRQCRTMIIVDAEHEAAGPYVFAGYVKLKTQLRAEMQLDLQIPDIDQYLEGARGGPESIRLPPPLAAGLARSTVSAPSTRPMSVVYIKLALDREHLESYPVAVQERARRSPVFPQDPTTNQAFTTEQFVAYRELGRHVASGVQSVIAAL